MKDNIKPDIERAAQELRLADHAYFRDAFNNLRIRHRKMFIVGIVSALFIVSFALWIVGCGIFHWVCKIPR